MIKDAFTRCAHTAPARPSTRRAEWAGAGRCAAILGEHSFKPMNAMGRSWSSQSFQRSGRKGKPPGTSTAKRATRRFICGKMLSGYDGNGGEQNFSICFVQFLSDCKTLQLALSH